MILRTEHVETAPGVLLELLSRSEIKELRHRSAGFGVRPHEKGSELVFHTTEAGPELHGHLQRFMADARGKHPELFDQSGGNGAGADEQTQLVQVGVSQPVAYGKPASIVSLGARVALANDPGEGTVGGILKDGSNDRYLLTCRHVLDGHEGARVVLRNPSGEEPWVAQLVKSSKWRLGDGGAHNRTDFALARILDTVVADTSTPPGMTLREHPLTHPAEYLSPIRNLKARGRVHGVCHGVRVDFPYANVRLSHMWMLDSVDETTLATFGDSGELFVAQMDDHTLSPEGLAVAVTSEYSVWNHGQLRLEQGSPRLLVCPVARILSELDQAGFKGLKFVP